MKRHWDVADRTNAAPEANGRSFLRSVLIGATIIIMMVPSLATTVKRIPVKKTGAGPLFQIHHGLKWGYMDRDGKTIIPAQFDDEGDFFNSRAKVRKGRKWGYIDDAGRLTIQYQFDNAGDFREGVAPVQVGRKWGFIDLSGAVVVEPQFQAAAEFSDGVARIEVWDTIRCDPTDYRKTVPEVYAKDDAPLRAFRLHDTPGASGGCFSERARYGYIDKGGNIAVPPRFIVAGDFSEGLAAVREEGASGSKYSYIDKTGKIVVRLRFDQALSFSEGLAAVALASDAYAGNKAWSWGFINRGGMFEIQPRFRLAHSFSEGLADVSRRDGTWGYIDRNGNFAIQPRYSETNPFSEGLALVWPMDDENGYYIDKAGRKALTLGLWPQWSFSDGLTVAGKEGERKYVDRKGRIVASYEVDPRI